MVNGVIYDFESIKVALPSGLITTVKDVNYSSKKDVEVVTDSKGMPRGVVRKKFEGDFSMTLSLAEYEEFSKAQASQGGVLGAPPFPVVVSYGAYGQPPVTDNLMVKITEIPREAKEDEEVVMKISGKQTAIPKLGGRPAYVPTY